jgi:hypothetical protein
MSKILAAPLARFVADDPRADSGLREVSVAAEAIAIDRRVAGVRMRVSAPVRSYRGVALGVREDVCGFSWRVTLIHSDADMNVVLAEAENEAQAAAEWQAWADYFRLPRLTQRLNGVVEAIERRFGAIQAGAVEPRRRGWPLKQRRSRISALRKAGPRGRAPVVHCDEREIICYE